MYSLAGKRIARMRRVMACRFDVFLDECSRAHKILRFDRRENRQMVARITPARFARTILPILDEPAHAMDAPHRLRDETIVRPAGERFMKLAIRFEQLDGRHVRVTGIDDELLPPAELRELMRVDSTKRSPGARSSCRAAELG